MKSISKVVVHGVTEQRSYVDGERRQTIHFKTDYDPSLPEDRRFERATPTGEMKMQITNQHLIGTFVPGDSYYVEFSKVDPKTA